MRRRRRSRAGHGDAPRPAGGGRPRSGDSRDRTHDDAAASPSVFVSPKKVDAGATARRRRDRRRRAVIQSRFRSCARVSCSLCAGRRGRICRAGADRPGDPLDPRTYEPKSKVVPRAARDGRAEVHVPGERDVALHRPGGDALQAERLAEGRGRAFPELRHRPAGVAVQGRKLGRGRPEGAVPAGAANIPWLLLERLTTEGDDGDGWTRTTWVQRLNTSAASRRPPCTPGAKLAVPYTADYVFWRAKGDAAPTAEVSLRDVSGGQSPDTSGVDMAVWSRRVLQAVFQTQFSSSQLTSTSTSRCTRSGRGRARRRGRCNRTHRRPCRRTSRCRRGRPPRSCRGFPPGGLRAKQLLDLGAPARFVSLPQPAAAATSASARSNRALIDPPRPTRASRTRQAAEPPVPRSCRRTDPARRPRPRSASGSTSRQGRRLGEQSWPPGRF